MVKIAAQPALRPVTTTVLPARPFHPVPAAQSWRNGLPTLVGASITLRELTLSDASALLAIMTPEAVARFISTPPSTVDGFERFIQWTHHERALGRYACFAIVPHGSSRPVGIFQLRQIEAHFVTAEWGFALDSAFWGNGYFKEGAQLLIDFAVDVVGVRRLEARSAVANGRGNGALRKMGAVHEGVLRRSFTKGGRQMDQSLWAILADEWRQAKAIWNPAVVH
jgi:[ribosomal protein S5]-alanine N-acetyltransferase